MTSYDTTNTARYVLKYLNCEHQHELMLRYGSTFLAISKGPVTAKLIFESMGAMLSSEFAFISAKVYPLGSAISVAVTAPDMDGINPSVYLNKEDAPNFVSFIGRSEPGQSVNWKIYGIFPDPAQVGGQNFRYEPGDSAVIYDTIAALRSDGELMATDRQKAVIASYANYGVHAGFQRKARRG